MLVSAGLDEIFGLSDRIAGIYERQIVAVADPETTTREEIGLLVAGATPPA